MMASLPPLDRRLAPAACACAALVLAAAWLALARRRRGAGKGAQRRYSALEAALLDEDDLVVLKSRVPLALRQGLYVLEMTYVAVRLAMCAEVSRARPALWLGPSFFAWLFAYAADYVEYSDNRRSKRGAGSGVALPLVVLLLGASSACVWLDSRWVVDAANVGFLALVILPAALAATARPAGAPDLVAAPLSVEEGTYGLREIVCFTWLYAPVLKPAQDRKLGPEDLPPMPRADTTANVWKRFAVACPRSHPSPRRLFLKLLFACPAHVLATAVMEVVGVACQFVTPAALYILLDEVDNKDEASGLSTRAALAVGGIFFGSLINAVTTALNQHLFERVGVRSRAALTQLIYRKALRLDMAALDTSLGEVTSLMSIDVNNILNSIYMIHLFWTPIVQILFALVLLVNYIGLAVLGGIALLVVMLICNAATFPYIQKYQIQLMKCKDGRLEAIAEVLGAARTIKLLAFEGDFIAKIAKLREAELSKLWSLQVLFVGVFTLILATPTLTNVAAFLTRTVLLGEQLSAATAFTSLALFEILRGSFVNLPWVITALMQAQVSLGRIDSFLDRSEMKSNLDGGDDDDTEPAAPQAARQAPQVARGAVVIDQAAFCWGDDAAEGAEAAAAAPRRGLLVGVDLDLAPGSLTVVVGLTGSGKSSLLSAILGEMRRTTGAVAVGGRVAFSPQKAWSLNASVRDNVLFGRAYDEKDFDEAVRCCALDADLAALPAGDATEVGERGITLSGGQQQRLALARCVYADADVYLLDDPLSAVDAHVGEHLLRECVAGRLAGKTRLLCTHQLQALAFADSVVVMDGGRVACQGSRADVAQQLRSTPLGREAARDDVAAPRDDDDLASQIINALSDERRAAALKRKAPEPRLASGSSNDLAGLGAALPQQLVQEEHRQDAAPGLASYLLYVRAAGGVSLFGLIIALHVSVSLVQLYQSRCLASWVKALDTSASVGPELYKYLGATAGYVGVLFVALLLRYVAAQKGARALHGRMFEAVLRAPVRFFDTNLLGRIINRFSSDMNDIDRQVMTTLMSFFWAGSALVPLFVVLATAAPALLIPLTVVCLGYVRVAIIFLAAARDLKRIDSTSKSPLYAHFSETLNGLAVVRGFRASERFSRHSADLVDAANRANFYLGATSRWLGIRLNAAGAAVAGGTALYLALTRAHSAAVTGLVLNYALSFQYAVIGLIQSEAQMEQSMVAVERVTEYVCLEPEAYAGPKAAPPGWPHSGAIELRNVKLRYAAPESGLGAAAVSAGAWVVDGVSLDVAAGERVGVVGRTGSGKSTLLLGLMRVLDKPRGCCEGSVRVDGVDVHALPLSELRARVAMVQQDPVLFRGTVRSNLDPFGKHSDADCTRAVGRVRCFAYDAGDAAHVLALDVSEGGANFSVGQRQLLCLARALLVGSRVLLLDEATANIDLETDHKIQAVIRDELDGVTVVTIAHRLRTVVDYHKVLVLGGGKVLEHDTPAKLLRNAASHFSKMCAKTGSLDELVRDSLDAERRFALDAKKNQ
ncbi:hypothetical protein M885DRAFT_626395 [Pelagophyceae sp. CCMP2097]|nr:hypothetical protein M885DRAFT_626395 [Pelagophyceae sp. CCMP2097]